MVDELPEPLVDLALWLADYYGSTPARALELVAPPKRKARGERPQPAERDSLGGEAEPAQLSESQHEPSPGIVEALDGGGGNVLLHGATGSGKTEVYLQAAPRRSSGERARSCSCRRSRSRRKRRPSASAVRRPRRRAPLVADGGGAAGRARADRERGGADRRRRPLGGLRPVAPLGVICVDEEHDASYKQEADPRYDARVAAKRAALEGAVAIFGTATPRPESWERLERLELGAVSRARCRRSASSTCAGRPAIRSRHRSSRSSAPWSRTEARRSCSSTAAASLSRPLRACG